MSDERKPIFLSYAHQDRKWVDELLKFLAPWLRDKRVGLWDDSQIQAGDQWRQGIDQAIAEASVGVLLVTADLLASSFVVNHELPALVRRADRKELRLIWIAVGYSAFETTDLVRFQAVNDPRRPLKSLETPQRDKVMVEIAKHIADATTIETLAGGLRIIDQTIEPLEARFEQRAERKDRQFSIQANYEPQQDRISFQGASTTITAADLEHLPDDDREFIADLEGSLRKNYERWRATRAGLGNAGGSLDTEINVQLSRITTLMCADLNSILDFLVKMHKAELADHYARYRHICQQVNTGGQK